MSAAEYTELDRLEWSSTQQPGELAQPAPAPGDSLTDDELRAFIGPNVRYYLRQWKPALEGQTSGLGFNIAAFFLAGLWIPYRKMVKTAFAFFGILLAVTILEMLLSSLVGSEIVLDFAFWIVAVIAWVVCGIFGNRWYFSRAERVINQVRTRQLPQPEHLRALSKAGGTSLGLSIGMFVLYMGATVATAVAADTLFARLGFGAPLTFNNGELYYVPPVTRQEAEKLGGYLVQTGFFDGERKTVQLAKSGNKFEFRMVVIKGFDRNPQFLETVRRFGHELSQNVFGGAVVDVHLCDEYLKTLKTVDGE